MKNISDVMATDVVWISPTARVKTAVILMKGHNIGALPVVHNHEGVIGLVTLLSLLGEPQDAYVADVMERKYSAITPDMSIYDAAEVMHSDKASHLLVMEDGQLVGIVSHSDMLPELGKAYDPLTGLPWSDTFREWAMAALKRGMEISVILFDLNQFGKFNKKHGHVVGDNVLKEVANVFKRGINTDIDLVCRYGGDEFAIVTLRNHDEARNLAEMLQKDIERIQIPNLPESISGSFGIYGGRRTKEREDMHYAATIDDLITRASKECIARKPRPAEVVARVPEAQAEQGTAEAAAVFVEPAHALAEGIVPRLKIQTIGLSITGPEATVAVTLAQGGREYKREVSGYVVGGKNILRLVAESTAGAVCKSLAPGSGIVVDDVLLVDIAPEEQIITVITTFITPRSSMRNVGSAVVRRGDQYRAAAAALLASVNRQLETTPGTQPEEIEEIEIKD